MDSPKTAAEDWRMFKIDDGNAPWYSRAPSAEAALEDARRYFTESVDIEEFPEDPWAAVEVEDVATDWEYPYIYEGPAETVTRTLRWAFEQHRDDEAFRWPESPYLFSMPQEYI